MLLSHSFDTYFYPHKAVSLLYVFCMHSADPPSRTVASNTEAQTPDRTIEFANAQVKHARTSSSNSPKHSRQPTRSHLSSLSKLNTASDIRRQSTTSSHHSHGRNASLSSSTRNHKAAGVGSSSLSMQRQEDLLALHFESCRLFQRGGPAAEPSIKPPASKGGHDDDDDDDDDTLDAIEPVVNPVQTGPSSQQQQQQERTEKQPRPSLSVTVPTIGRTIDSKKAYVSDGTGLSSGRMSNDTAAIDWMTASTRRREYEKIDRANRGIRGWWRRMAPRCCRSRDARTPFFEEKDGRGNYEGSVRRFRMDLPDDELQPRPSEQFVRSGSSVKGQLLPKTGNKNGRSFLCCF